MKSLTTHKADIKTIALMVGALFMVIVLAFQLPVSAANTFPHQYELVSVNNVDGQGIDRNASVGGVSADGNKVLFTTSAANLPQANTNHQWGGYIRDINMGTTTKIDVSKNGTVPNSMTSQHVMSMTGRYVVFKSSASNLIDGQSLDNSINRVYLKDLQTGNVELITNISGPSSSYDVSIQPVSVSSDGRFVVISTYNINRILPGTRTGVGNYVDLLLFDREKDSWTILNKGVDGILQKVHAISGGVSCDGSIISFDTSATNITNDFSGSGKHVYIADLRNGLNITDLTPGGVGDSYDPKISCDGRYITYQTQDRTLITPAPSGMPADNQPVRFDRITGERIYISSSSNGQGFGGTVRDVSDKGDIVMAIGSSQPKMYFKHLSDGSGTVEQVQHNYSGLLVDGTNVTARLSADSKYVVVSSKDGGVLGLPVSTINGVSVYNIIRIKTGL